MRTVNNGARLSRSLRFGSSPTRRRTSLAAEGKGDLHHHRSNPSSPSQPDGRVFSPTRIDIITTLDRLRCNLAAILRSGNDGWARPTFPVNARIIRGRGCAGAVGSFKARHVSEGTSKRSLALASRLPVWRYPARRHATEMARLGDAELTRVSEQPAPAALLGRATERSRMGRRRAGNNRSAHTAPRARGCNNRPGSAPIGSRPATTRGSTSATPSCQYASCANSLLGCQPGREKVADDNNPAGGRQA